MGLRYLIIRVMCICMLVMFLAQSCMYGQGKRYEEVIIKTESGDIHVQLDLKRAKVTSLNFLRYADAGMYKDACFYRVVRMDNQPKDSVKIEVIQGGRFENEDKGFPPIIHETTEMTGIRHRDGTISMARSKPGSATSEFFICVGDQPELDYRGRRNPDLQGFAAFGRVTGGMDIVRKIHSVSAPGQYLEKKVRIIDISRF
jgi:peptidyl-prolyl cis-trans isomerase A (cyclophilin A)